MRFSNLFVLILGVLLALGCKHDIPTIPEDATPKGEDTLTTDSLCDPMEVFFVNDIQPILSSSCALSGCHNATSKPKGLDLTTYDGLWNADDNDIVVAGDPSKSELYDALEDGKMPPSGPALSSSDQQLIFDWISQGAKNNECHDCDTSQYGFQAEILPIIEKNCLSCHNGPSGNKGIDLSAHSTISPHVSSDLLRKVIVGEAGVSQMPPSGNLSACDKDKLLNWINAGGPND
jgi:hypothetical protein